MAALSRAKRNSLRNSVRGNRFANDCAIVGRLAVEFPSDSPIRVESYRVEDEKRRNGGERESRNGGSSVCLTWSPADGERFATNDRYLSLPRISRTVESYVTAA